MTYVAQADPIFHGSAPKELMCRTDISAPAKLILCRIYTLTKGGKNECFLSTAVIMDLLGLAKRTVERAITELEDKDIISRITRKPKSKVQRYIYYIYKNANMALSENANMAQTTRHNGTIENANMALSYSLYKKDYKEGCIRVSGTHSNHTPISFNFDYVKSTFDDCVNELLEEYPYLKQVDLNKSLQRYWYQKHTKIEKGYWKKGEKVTEQSLKDSILSWLLNENKPEQVNSEEDFSQDLNDLENDLLLTNFTPADKGDYQQSVNDGFTDCEVIEDEHSKVN